MSDEIISKTLKIVEINVNSIIFISRRYNLSKFLQYHKPDIVLLNETKLNKKHKVSFESYDMIRTDRPNSSRGGGTAILIKSDIKYNVYSDNIIRNFKYLEVTIIKVPLKERKILFIISAYYPSGNTDPYFQTELNRLFDILNIEDTNNFYILGGDLNSKRKEWANKENNVKGNALKSWLSENETNYRCKLYASIRPSYPRTESYLDVFIVDNRIKVHAENTAINCIKTIPYDSDHNALIFTASMNTNNELFNLLKALPDMIFDYRSTNWEKFRMRMTQKANDNLTVPNSYNLANEEIDHYLNQLHDLIEETTKEVVPKFRRTRFSILTNSVIERLHREKSRVLTIIKKNNRLTNPISESRLALLKAILKRIKKLISDNLVIAMNKHYEKSIRAIKVRNSADMFRKIRKNFKKIEDLDIDTLKIPNSLSHIISNAGIDSQSLVVDADRNFIIKDNDDIVNVIGSYLESIHSVKSVDYNNDVQTHVTFAFNEFLDAKNAYEGDDMRITTFTEAKNANALTEEQANDIFVTRENILGIFGSLRGKLSSGLDNIPNLVLKNLPDKIKLHYCTIFNNSINNSYFPYGWKKAKVVMIPKKDKDSTNPRNLRPISLLPNISKVFEMCVNNILRQNCERLNLVSERQFGFKYKHSTINAINVLVSDINWNWNRRLCTGACSVDMEKAFDTIWLQGLVYKLMNYNFPLHLVILIYNMIFNKSFVITHKNKLSREFRMSNGLQQGTVNAPLLFNLYLLDLISDLENVISFADDILIYQPGQTIECINNGLQCSFNLIEDYARDWHMRINAGKCETILFRPTVSKCNTDIRRNWKSFKVRSYSENKEIPNVSIIKYLGIHLDKFLYYNQHVANSIEKARRAFYAYRRLFYSRHLDASVKILMYQSFVRPILTYGCPIWFNVSPSYMEKVRLFERKCLRACTSMYKNPRSDFRKFYSNQRLYKAADIIRIDNFVIGLIRKHIDRCSQCTEYNLIMAPFYTDENYIKRSIVKGNVPPESFVFLDRYKYIQNTDGIPIFYHLYRRATDKIIDYDRNDLQNVRFDMAISEKDKNIAKLVSIHKFWWLEPQ